MSDLTMYELEDIISDDFDRGDARIVPHHTNTLTSRNSSKGGSSNKPCETTPVLSKTGNLDAFDAICQEKAKRDSKPLDKKKNIMEKESHSNAAPGVFNASFDGDIVKDMPNLGTDDTRMPNNCFKSSYATPAAGDNNSYNYMLTQAGDLSFVNNNCEKESGDLYYAWSDIGDFEDVDKMLRSCDSSFGLGVTDNDDELGWFSSAQIEGTEEAFKMDFNYPCHEPSRLKNILHPDHDSSESNSHSSGCISDSKNGLNSKDQTNLKTKHSKHQNQTEGKKAGLGLRNDGSFYQTSDLTGNNSQLSSDNISDQVFTSVDNQQQYRNLETDYFGHMPRNTYYQHPHYPHQNTAVPILSGSMSDHKGYKSTSPMGSSYASNQGRSTGSSGDPSFEGAAAEVNELNQSCNSQRFQSVLIGSPRQMGMMFQSSKGVMDAAEKQGHLSVEEHESQSDIDGVPKQLEIGSLNVQESSSVSSDLDAISLEAASFCQLRHAMEQLDLRSKLCIRDSLYRLARSAEQRHHDPSLSSHNNIGGPLMVERSNKCTGFMDIETDTNPIDRSVAHLLFHRPSESLKSPTPLPHNANMNHGSIQGPSMLAEKLVFQDTAAESNETICGD